MKEFLNLVPLEEFYSFLKIYSPPMESEVVGLLDSNFRVCSKSIFATEAIPQYNRSSVDGYAVRFQNTLGASSSSPVILKNKGEIKMGENPSFSISDGEAIYVPTGGAIPNGADSVVMVENTELTNNVLEIYKQVNFQENLILEGEDFKKGAVLIEKGRRIYPKDVGALAAMGIKKVEVFKLPRISIFSTGNEIVEEKETKYQIRDSNSYVVASMTNKIANPKRLGILKDDYDEIYNSIKKIYDSSDVIVLSGGSSMGIRDYTLDIFKKFGKAIYKIHGVRIKPGKPTIVYITKDKIFVGLPGHPVSSFISSKFVLIPLLRKLSGEANFKPIAQKLVKSKIRIPSQEGRKDFYRVKLDKNGYFDPIFSKSSSLSSLLYCDGIVEIDENSEGIYEGEEVPYYSLEET